MLDEYIYEYLHENQINATDCWSYSSKATSWDIENLGLLYYTRAISYESYNDDTEKYMIIAAAWGNEKAIEWCIEHGIQNLILYHDYIGIQKWAEHEWKCNIPLTENYQKFIDSIKDKICIQFCKCAAHTGIRYNEMADQLAKDAITEYLKKQ